MKRVKLLVDYHSALWPNGRSGDEREVSDAVWQQLQEDLGTYKFQVTEVVEDVVEAPEPPEAEVVVEEKKGMFGRTKK